MPDLLALILGAYGLVLGGALASFACVVSERVPAGKSITGRSRCGCGRQLRWFENVPVLGWVSCRGRARCCGATLPARYVLCEAGLAQAVGGSAALAGWAVSTGRGPGELALLTVLVAVAGSVLVAAVTWQRHGTGD